MEQECWRTHIDVNAEWSTETLAIRIKQLDKCQSLRVRYEARSRTVTIVLDTPSSLKNAPSGTHEFARGWIACKDAHLASRLFNQRLVWKPIKWYDYGRVVDDTSSIRSSFTTEP